MRITLAFLIGLLVGPAAFGQGNPAFNSVKTGPSVGTKPACTVTDRFRTWTIAGGAGVADLVEVCDKDDLNLYAWKPVWGLFDRVVVGSVKSYTSLAPIYPGSTANHSFAVLTERTGNEDQNAGMTNYMKYAPTATAGVPGAEIALGSDFELEFAGNSDQSNRSIQTFYLAMTKSGTANIDSMNALRVENFINGSGLSKLAAVNAHSLLTASIGDDVGYTIFTEITGSGAVTQTSIGYHERVTLRNTASINERTAFKAESPLLFDSSSITTLRSFWAPDASGVAEFSAGVAITPPITAGEPTCDVAHRFWLWTIPGAATVADKAEVCDKDAADVYAWRDLVSCPDCVTISTTQTITGLKTIDNDLRFTNDRKILWKDSAGTLISNLWFDSSNQFNIGSQNVTASGGFLVFWDNGTAELRLGSAGLLPLATNTISLGSAFFRYLKAWAKDIDASGVVNADSMTANSFQGGTFAGPTSLTLGVDLSSTGRIHLFNQTTTGNVILDTVGNANVGFAARVSRPVVPSADDLYSLGASDKQWSDIRTVNITISGTCTGCGANSHNLFSATHPDTLPASPVLGDTIYANGTPVWTTVPGNITTTKKYYTQTGTGTVSAAPGWNIIARGDLPALNITTNSPLGGGGNLAAGDLTLTCVTCLTGASANVFNANMTFNANETYEIGSSSGGSGGGALNVYTKNLEAGRSAAVTGTINFHHLTVSGTSFIRAANVTGSLDLEFGFTTGGAGYPDTNNAYNWGISTRRWAKFYGVNADLSGDISNLVNINSATGFAKFDGGYRVGGNTGTTNNLSCSAQQAITALNSQGGIVISESCAALSGVTVSGTTCTITDIVNGIITGASCV